MFPTPVFGDGIVYAGSAGTGGGAVRLLAKDGAVAAESLYFEANLPNAIGGAVKLGDYLYGTTGSALLCLDFHTGQVKWRDRALGAVSLCFADGRLYLHGENSEVALVEPSPDGYREQGRFTPPDPPKTHRRHGESVGVPGRCRRKALPPRPRLPVVL